MREWLTNYLLWHRILKRAPSSYSITTLVKRGSTPKSFVIAQFITLNLEAIEMNKKNLLQLLQKTFANIIHLNAIYFHKAPEIGLKFSDKPKQHATEKESFVVQYYYC